MDHPQLPTFPPTRGRHVEDHPHPLTRPATPPPPYTESALNVIETQQALPQADPWPLPQVGLPSPLVNANIQPPSPPPEYEPPRARLPYSTSSRERAIEEAIRKEVARKAAIKEREERIQAEIERRKSTAERAKAVAQSQKALAEAAHRERERIDKETQQRLHKAKREATLLELEYEERERKIREGKRIAERERLAAQIRKQNAKVEASVRGARGEGEALLQSTRVEASRHERNGRDREERILAERRRLQLEAQRSKFEAVKYQESERVGDFGHESRREIPLGVSEGRRVVVDQVRGPRERNLVEQRDRERRLADQRMGEQRRAALRLLAVQRVESERIGGLRKLGRKIRDGAVMR